MLVNSSFPCKQSLSLFFTEVKLGTVYQLQYLGSHSSLVPISHNVCWYTLRTMAQVFCRVKLL